MLIVDDDECTRWTLSMYLRQKGLPVSTVATDNEGLRRANHTSPDVILLDYRLGDMDGLEFLRLLHDEMAVRVPAVAVFTADWSPFDRFEEIGALGATVLSKLCDLNEVWQLIANLSNPVKRNDSN